MRIRLNIFLIQSRPSRVQDFYVHEKVTHSDNLPHESEDDVLPTFGENVGVHVDDVAADGLRRGDGQGQVLVRLEEGQLGALVDHPRVDGVRHGEVDQFAGKVSFPLSVALIYSALHQVGKTVPGSDPVLFA